MNLELAGRTALVTGGNTGLGRVIALALVQVGADVVLTYFLNASDQTLNEI